MGIKFDVESLNTLFQSFHNISGVKIGIYLPDGSSLPLMGGKECEFCRLVRSDSSFLEKCLADDKAAFEAAMRGETKIYRCHAGLYESVTPIIYDDMPVACLMIGQLAPHTPEEKIKNEISERLKGHPKLNDIIDAFKKMTPNSDDYLASCSKIMNACASYIYLCKLVSLEKSSLLTRLNEYIKDNYKNDISLNDMANSLGICVTKLCNTIRKECNTSPHSMLISYRIEKAKQLLVNTNFKINEISYKVGMYDYNYFSRVFKRLTGLTPMQFRKSNKV